MDPMNRPVERLGNRVFVLCGVALVFVAGLTSRTGAAAECCFNNPRYSGTCRQVVTGGDTCAGILAYLNSLSSVGKAYCGFTDVRGGWGQVRCDPSQSTSSTTESGSDVIKDEPQTLESVELGSAVEAQTPVLMPSTSVLQVSFDREVDLVSETPGSPIGGRLTDDVIVDGVLVAPRGSRIHGQVAAGPTGPQVELTRISIQGTSHPLVLGELWVASVSPGTAGVMVSMPNALVGADRPVRLAVAAVLSPSDESADSLELSRALIQSERRSLVVAAMQLTESEATDFWPLYDEYRRVMDEVGTRRVKQIQTLVDAHDTLTDAGAERLIDEAIAIDHVRLKVRRRYVRRLGKVLPMTKVARFFQLEEKMDAVIHAELTQAIPLVD